MALRFKLIILLNYYGGKSTQIDPSRHFKLPPVLEIKEQLFL